jgi:LacI family transcriptional regulator
VSKRLKLRPLNLRLAEIKNPSNGHVSRTLQDRTYICKAPCGYDGHVTTIHDVAKRAGVSATTAKRAIHEPQLLTKATLERVRNAITDLNYEPDRTAGALRRGHSHTIGLMVGNIIEFFFAQLTRTVAKAVHARGYALIVADNEYDSSLELENLRMFHGHRVSGLIVRSAFGSGNLEYLKRLHEQGTYILEIDHFLADSPFGHVMLENTECVHMGVRYLHDLGHKRIAALTVFDAEKLQDERGKAFPNVMKSFGLRVPKAYQRGATLSEEGAYSLTLELLRLPEPPTAIFSMTGNEAAGAFRAIRELKLRIPEDVSFLTFDDYSWTSLVNPPLDVITQPIEDMGLAAVDIVMNAIQSRDLTQVVRKRFPGKLIRRGSCAPPKRAR